MMKEARTACISGMLGTRPLTPRELQCKGQGEQGAEEQPRPDDLQHRNALLAQVLGDHVEEGQHGHGREHQADAEQRAVDGLCSCGGTGGGCVRSPHEGPADRTGLGLQRAGT